jgi:N-acyl-L-homoserine lactone synthetase
MSLLDRTTRDAPVLTDVTTRGAATDLRIHGIRYRVRELDWRDQARHAAYQRLRGHIFVHQLGWRLALEPDGREVDRYDIGGGRAITVHCIYGMDERTEREHLLAGMRIFHLRTWDDSMLTHEFASAGMVPPGVLEELDARFAPTELLDLTRLCSWLGTWYAPVAAYDTPEEAPRFDLAIARDLLYAALWEVAMRTERDIAICLTDALFLRVLRRAHFEVEELYSKDIGKRTGLAVAIIDLAASLQSVRLKDGMERAQRITALSDREAPIRIHV